MIMMDNRPHHADANTTWMLMTMIRMVRMMVMTMITIQQTTLHCLGDDNDADQKYVYHDLNSDEDNPSEEDEDYDFSDDYVDDFDDGNYLDADSESFLVACWPKMESDYLFLFYQEPQGALVFA